MTRASDCLRDVLARLDWASSRIDEFERAASAFEKACPCLITDDRKVEWKDPYFIPITTYRVKAGMDVPFELRVLAGDAIHHLRSSVDNLVWGLGCVCGAKKSLSLFFKENAAEFAKKAKADKLDRLPQDIQAWFEEQQTYKTGPHHTSPFYKLNALWNEDKHRLPALVTNQNPATAIGEDQIGPLELVICSTHDGETVIVAHGEGELNPRFSIEVRFPEVNHPSAVPFLRDMHRHIRQDVIPRFEPHFPLA